VLGRYGVGTPGREGAGLLERAGAGVALAGGSSMMCTERELSSSLCAITGDASQMIAASPARR
jgi:hypothetical protein